MDGWIDRWREREGKEKKEKTTDKREKETKEGKKKNHALRWARVGVEAVAGDQSRVRQHRDG